MLQHSNGATRYAVHVLTGRSCCNEVAVISRIFHEEPERLCSSWTGGLSALGAAMTHRPPRGEDRAAFVDAAFHNLKVPSIRFSGRRHGRAPLQLLESHFPTATPLANFNFIKTVICFCL